jgi:L-cysteine/cystine lyase
MTISNNLSLERYRQQFPSLANKAYFNYGGQGPMPQVALEAIHQSFQEIQALGPFSGKVNDWIGEESSYTRAAIAAELAVPAAAIALTEDVSVGCNIGLWGIDWQPGNHLLISDCEHPGIIAAVQEIQRRFQVEVSVCPLRQTLNEGDPVDVLLRHLKPTTRLVVLSHILWNTGQVLPLKEITSACHTYPSHQPIRVLVDAAQSVGVLPLDLTELEVDFYAFTGHKWWCGPEGLGGLYVRPEAQADLHPTFIGWRGVNQNASGQPVGWKPDSRRYEIATSAYPLFAGLRQAIVLHQQWGTPEARLSRIQYLSQYLWQQLKQLPHITCLRTSPPEAGLVSFQLSEGHHRQRVETLEQQGVMVRTILNPDCIRACVHYFTTEAEIDTLVQKLQ